MHLMGNRCDVLIGQLESHAYHIARDAGPRDSQFQ